MCNTQTHETTGVSPLSLSLLLLYTHLRCDNRHIFLPIYFKFVVKLGPLGETGGCVYV